MRVLMLVVSMLAGCVGEDPARPSLDGPYECGPNTCSSGQICVTASSGSQCQVNEDAGIGQYQTYAWSCVDLPRECDGVPSCECITGPGICALSSDGRTADFGCI